MHTHKTHSQPAAPSTIITLSQLFQPSVKYIRTILGQTVVNRLSTFILNCIVGSLALEMGKPNTKISVLVYQEYSEGKVMMKIIFT